MITNRKHQNIVTELSFKLSKKELEIEQLKVQLAHARDLKAIVEKIAQVKIGSDSLLYSDGTTISTGWGEMPDNVLVYVDDILGGQVIKQEANKCLVIDFDGNVEEGLTKDKVDKGYNYKLVRK